MSRCPHSCGSIPAAVFGSMVLFAIAASATAQGAVAPDGITVVGTPDDATPSRAQRASSGCLADLVFFEENGAIGFSRGLYDLTSGTGLSTLRTTVLGTQRLFSLAVDPFTGTVYGVDPLARNLYTVDLATGTVTFFIALTGTTTLADISFHPFTAQLYGLDRNSSQFYTIDLGTGVATALGSSSPVRTGLTFAPDSTLFGCTLNGTLYRIDPATGAPTLVGGGGGPGLLEDATVRGDGTIFVTDFNGDAFSIDPLTGTNTFLGNDGMGNGCLGIIPSPDAHLSFESIRSGTPPNPTALLPGLTSPPIVGSVWDPIVDHSTFFPTSALDFLGLSLAPTNVPSPFGTLLIASPVILVGAPGIPFSIPIPLDCRFAGFPISLQAASTDGVAIVATNALDAVIGSY